mmetsp:Transcript_64944/g.101314  ORF Transcript_64944/g.101314 Transcript_64944/m.101314 type:complete len:529 (+) Transcript_64944:74-1660(+)
MKHLGRTSPRVHSRPVVPSIPLEKVRSPRMSPRSLSSPTASKLRNSHVACNSRSVFRIGLGSSAVDDSSIEMKVSPRFGLEPTSPTRQVGALRTACTSERQAKAVAAHIARQRENRSEVSVRINPLLTGKAHNNGTKPSKSHASNQCRQSKPIHQSLDSANFSSIFEDAMTMSDVGTDFDSCSLAESTSGKISSLCEKVEIMMGELVEMVGPLTPPLTPKASVVPETSEHKENHARMENSSNHRILRQCSELKGGSSCVGYAAKLGVSNTATGCDIFGTLKKGGEDISDLQFRISRLELQVGQITNAKAKQVTVAEDVAELKRWLEIAQAELSSTREEARETKVQLDVLTKRASMMEVRSGSFPGLAHVSCLDNSDVSTLPAESGCGAHRLSSVSSDGSQVLHGLPFACERSPVQLPRARSFDSTRQQFYPIPRSNEQRSHQGTHQQGKNEVLAPRRRSFPSPPPRVGDKAMDARVCTAEQLVKGMQHNTFRLQKTADSAACSRSGKGAKPWRAAQFCTPSVKTTSFA